MTIKETYERLGGNYEDIMCRVSETMLLRLISMLLRDTNYADICTALKQHDYETAFRGAHTLKGIALNLGLTLLAEKTSILTEALRARRDNADIEPAFFEFEQAYQSMHMTFSKLLDSSASGGDGQ